MKTKISTKISKWGNSLGIRLPKDVLDLFRLTIGSRVDISQTKEGILIKPVIQKMTLEQMLNTVTPEQIHPILFAEGSRGKEII